MELSFSKIRVGERFRTVDAKINEVWVKITPNRKGHNARALHSGAFQAIEESDTVILVREGGKAGPKKMDFGQA